MEKKYWNRGAFMTGLNTMIVADEQRLDEIADPVIREAVRKQLEVKLPVHPDKVLIKMECVGVCGSDVHYFHEGQCGTFFLDPGRDIPYMLGHEAAGTVVEVGANVTGLSVGDRVCCEPGKACGKCEMCRAGKYNLCRDVIFWATPPVQGCYMRYVEFYADLCFRIPDSMSMEAGAMVEPFATAMFAAETAEVQKGDSVLIMGSGCIGLMTLLACRYKGAENVILCDLEDIRLNKAMELGASAVINNGKCSEEAFYAEVRRLTDGGPRVVIEAIGNAVTIRQSGELARRGGVVVLLGMPPEDVIPFNINAIMDNEVQIRPIFRYRYIFPECIKAASASCPIEKVISDEYELDDIQTAFEDSISRKNEVVKAAIRIR
ncbi:MAG: NAD(P)-dependent alcohol dehydrogenase [Oscillospiraceae bacterium]|nr:NAD(P)-dependent alcohol dehydrogenase [Oscillospiraceae bacterium]